VSYTSILTELGLSDAEIANGTLNVQTPIDGSEFASVVETDPAAMTDIIGNAKKAFGEWRQVPGPRRGELIRLLGEELRAAKEPLGRLVSLECGKIYPEGLGEVQEMIDTWHPLGVVGVISAFNFPVAVWSWNTALALVCGNSVIWKPSEKTPVVALACQKILEKALAKFGDAPANLHQVVVGDRQIGEALTNSHDVALVSATGSTRMGREVAPRVAERFGRTILELGGNNAMIVTPSADLDMTVRAVVFSAVGTCGQRCTSLRRLIVHKDVKDQLLPKIVAAYKSVKIGDPLADGTLVGPLIDEDSFNNMQNALASAKKDGGTVHGGERTLASEYPNAFYVTPAVVEMPSQTETVRNETFAPILYVMTYETLEEAIALQNGVPQGLSSCIFSTDLRETELFLSAVGSDCGIANVNIGPSGAEIGGAFGGEKETGGGRESGSDAWKGYMRRATNTINYSRELPLAQGIKFDI
jgi:aldehyde dehydrogenase (NAD+)